jgi:hypothetical protein
MNKIIEYIAWCIFFILLEIMFLNLPFLSQKMFNDLSKLIVLLLLAILLFFLILKPFIKNDFFSMQTILSSIFKGKLWEIDNKFIPQGSDKKTLKPNYSFWQKSNYYNKLHNANIILIMLESVAASYLYPKKREGLKLSFFETLKQTWSSNYHICISPNTNSSYRTTFSGTYYETQNKKSHIKTLQYNKYCPIYVGCCQLHGGTENLLKTYGFEHVIKQNKPFVTDKKYYQKTLPNLINLLNKNNKFLLCLTNKQTHIPYQIENSIKSNNIHDNYIQACKESDLLMQKTINAISNEIDLSNTIIIYTSDHGQSFGEMSYRIHSNSIIKEQLLVPFALHHPKLTNKTIDFSSHFDIFNFWITYNIKYTQNIYSRSI